MGTGARPLGTHSGLLTRATPCKNIPEAASVEHLHEKQSKQTKPGQESDIRGLLPRTHAAQMWRLPEIPVEGWGLAGRYHITDININWTFFFYYMDEGGLLTSLFIWVNAWKVSFKCEGHIRVRPRGKQFILKHDMMSGAAWWRSG